MGKDSKPKESGGKGKGKQAASGSDDKGKGKGGKGGDGLGTCTYVKARHVLCEKQGKINEAYKKLQDGWLENGDKVPPAEFAKNVRLEKKGGDLGWFPRGKMAGPFKMLPSAHLLEPQVLLLSERMVTTLSCVKEERIDNETGFQCARAFNFCVVNGLEVASLSLETDL
ncbi:hypothetical protein L6164_014559 [Bauhinia variegata]|uniref:Uncharacterized protein n=1 Tax=Bauhinia variegata TaxID=167791 RepID=A0ACB9NMJ5_BAUVA|nr:hypothetical protein L6164_014559 [Bauhinia variegata]